MVFQGSIPNAYIQFPCQTMVYVCCTEQVYDQLPISCLRKSCLLLLTVFVFCDFFFPSKLLSSSIFLLKCSSLGHLLVMFQYLIFFQNKMSPCFVSKAPPFGKTTEQITAAHIGITLLELISSFALQLK